MWRIPGLSRAGRAVPGGGRRAARALGLAAPSRGCGRRTPRPRRDARAHARRRARSLHVAAGAGRPRPRRCWAPSRWSSACTCRTSMSAARATSSATRRRRSSPTPAPRRRSTRGAVDPHYLEASALESHGQPPRRERPAAGRRRLNPRASCRSACSATSRRAAGTTRGARLLPRALARDPLDTGLQQLAARGPAAPS